MGFGVRRWYISIVLGGTISCMWEVGLYVVCHQSYHYDLGIVFFFPFFFIFLLVLGVQYVVPTWCSLCCCSCVAFIVLLLLLGVV